LHRAADIYDRMLKDRQCGVILTLAGSLISAGLKKIFVDMVKNNMVDAIVSTGANIVDQDFFEALGFKHYIAEDKLKSGLFDGQLREHALDRIYDTLIDEEELRICDETTQKIFDEMEPGPHSSREFIRAMGEHLEKSGGPKGDGSIIYEAFKRDIPIFCPAFNDCSAGFGLVAHAVARNYDSARTATWDGGKDFYELTQLKIKNPTTGIFMLGGGVPKNFTQDIVVCAEVLGHDAPMHKYAKGSQQLGQGGHDVRADGIQRSNASRAADRRIRLPQGKLEGPAGKEVVAIAGSSAGRRELIDASFRHAHQLMLSLCLPQLRKRIHRRLFFA
jgi:deoxyhypusine synthase